MVRVLKDPKERRDEILDVADELFRTKGYEATTTNDILDKAGIARGTLYYYFKAKDDILNAVIDRSIDRGVEQLYQIVGDDRMNAVQKLKLIVSNGFQNPEEHEEFFDYLHKKETDVMHLRSLIQSVKKFSPVFAEIIRQGIGEGTFKTEYSLQLSEFIMVISNFLFDPGMFSLSKEEYVKKMKALEDMMETTLRAEKGTFGFLSSLADEMIKS
jgi:AcrR family transcriptional regulator